MRANRGDFGKPGVDSPFRSRSIDENLARFREMRDGKLADGAAVLRAKIDMASPTSTCATRPSTAYAAPTTTTPATNGASTRCTPSRTRSKTRSSNITHSLCTLEFEDQRPFYDWLLDRLAEGGLIATPHPRQYEFARLNLTYVITSKRKLASWSMKSASAAGTTRACPPSSACAAAATRPKPAAVCRAHRRHQSDSWIDYSTLEGALRDDLDPKAPRAMAVLDPVKLVLRTGAK
jgi:glutaminyl-tRNA synthetase